MMKMVCRQEGNWHHHYHHQQVYRQHHHHYLQLGHVHHPRLDQLCGWTRCFRPLPPWNISGQHHCHRRRRRRRRRHRHHYHFQERYVSQKEAEHLAKMAGGQTEDIMAAKYEQIVNNFSWICRIVQNMKGHHDCKVCTIFKKKIHEQIQSKLCH